LEQPGGGTAENVKTEDAADFRPIEGFAAMYITVYRGTT
jgi:hypothetical protein